LVVAAGDSLAEVPVEVDSLARIAGRNEKVAVLEGVDISLVNWSWAAAGEVCRRDCWGADDSVEVLEGAGIRPPFSLSSSGDRTCWFRCTVFSREK
jgi:hypothetical protein